MSTIEKQSRHGVPASSINPGDLAVIKATPALFKIIRAELLDALSREKNHDLNLINQDCSPQQIISALSELPDLFVALDSERSVLGFAGLNCHGIFEYTYVFHPFRISGIHRQLIRARLDHAMTQGFTGYMPLYGPRIRRVCTA